MITEAEEVFVKRGCSSQTSVIFVLRRKFAFLSRLRVDVAAQMGGITDRHIGDLMSPGPW